MGETLQETIRRALPDLLRADPGFRHEILEITRAAYADRDETAARFDRVLAELQRDREAQSREWEEQNRKRDRQMDIYLFDRKAAFYAQRHQCTVTRKLAISPMVRPNARAVAERLGIEVHGYAEDAALGD